jgi:DNA ligase (NAD+)
MTKEELLSAIKQADHEYYDLDNPSMSDAEYDQLRRSYIDQYGAEDLNYVPGNAVDGFEKFRHPTPVTSLGKWTKGVDDESDLKAQIKKLWPVEVQPKYDGLTIVAYPNKNGSCKFVTRGLGGEVGEILPNFIPDYEGTHVNDSGYPIRGEVFITPGNFEMLNRMLEADGKEPMKNMRNAAAGLLRRKERSPYLDLLTYIVYDIPGADMTPEKMRTEIMLSTRFRFTDGFSYETPEDTVSGIEQVYEDIVSIGAFPIDGIVIKSCQENSLAKFGNTGHHPKNAVAWKPGRTVFTTVVRDVIWQMGRSKATPVAIVDPVEIDGATVTKASLHNAEQIRKLGLKIGAKVTIFKANEIIPQLGEVLEPGDKDIVLDVCPACGGPLKTVNGQQFCTNPDCTERIAQNIAFLGQKDVLDIPGLSIQTARKIVEKWPDTSKEYKQNIIFAMDVSAIKDLPGFAEKSAQKLCDAIQKARKDVELPRFIKALCIPGIGNNIGKILADKYGSLDELCTACTGSGVVERLQRIDGIGPVAAQTIALDEFWSAVSDLKDYVTIASYEKKDVVVGEFVGKVFVLTGKMAHPRSYYVEKIEAAGGKEGSAVNSKTDYLVIADVNSQSSKAKKARELGTTLISPEELEEMLK